MPDTPSASPLPLAFTGERFTPETRGEIYYEHWHRYCFALPFAAGKRVLDAACGEGYGTALLGRVAREVVGVDISAEVVAHATRRYAHAGPVRYEQSSVTQVGLPDASVDLVVSFETIEHIVEQEAMLAEFRRVLAPDGLLLVSSPNKRTYSDERGYANEFHSRELTRDELSDMLERYFPRQAWVGQRLMFHSLMWPEVPPTANCGFESLTIDADGDVRPGAPADPMYFLVLCGGPQAVLPALDQVSLLADRDMSIYREFERTTRAERKIHAMYVEQEAALAQSRAELAQARAEFVQANAEFAQARAEFATAAEQSRADRAEASARYDAMLADSERRLEELREVLRGERARSAEMKEALEQRQREIAEVRGRLTYRESLAGWLRLPLSRLKRSVTGGS